MLDDGAPLAGDLVVDTRTGTGTRDGRPWLRFDGVEGFLLPHQTGHRLDFTGSSAEESLTFAAGDISDEPSYAGAVDMGGGDDAVVVPLARREVEARDRTLRGGHGGATLHVTSWDTTLDLTVDGAEGAVTAPGAGRTEFDGFEVYGPGAAGR